MFEYITEYSMYIFIQSVYNSFPQILIEHLLYAQQLLIGSLNSCLLISYNVPGTDLDAETIAVNLFRA